MKYIELTQGKRAIVDDEDYEYLNQFKWTYHDANYAYRKDKGKTIYMHRVITNTPEGMETDHRNGNGLDNRKSNLRTVTHHHNRMNNKLQTNNTSGFPGISWSKRTNKWYAHIQVNRKLKNLGLYPTIEEALSARFAGEAEYFGEFARKEKQWA